MSDDDMTVIEREARALLEQLWDLIEQFEQQLQEADQ